MCHLTQPTWPWSNSSTGPDDSVINDESSSVISSEFTPSDEDFGWNALKGDTIKRRFKKLVGRGPNESVANDALAEGDDLFVQKEYKAALKQYYRVD